MFSNPQNPSGASKTERIPACADIKGSLWKLFREFIKVQLHRRLLVSRMESYYVLLLHLRPLYRRWLEFSPSVMLQNSNEGWKMLTNGCKLNSR